MSTRSAKICDVCTVVGGGTPARDVAEFYGGSIPWVTPKDMKTWEIKGSQVNITDAGLQNSATRLVPQNSVLVVVRSGVLKHTLPVGINRVPVAINQDMKALLCSDGTDPDYLARFIKARSPVILKWVRATTADNFPIDKLKRLEIPLPPLPEQRRIAEILDKADTLRAKRRAALAKLDSLALSIFLDLHQSAKSMSRSMPLSDVAEATRGPFVNGPFGSNLLTSELHEEGVPVIYIRDIRDGEYDRVSKSCVTEQKARDLAVCSVQPRDVLVAKVGDPPGIAAVYPETQPVGVVTQDVIRMRVSRNTAFPEFIVAYLNAPVGRWKVAGITIEATRARFALKDFKALNIEVPPIAMQREFARQVRAAAQLKTAQRASLAELDALFATLQLRAFRGELVL